MTPAEQLQWARYLLDHGDAATAGVWPRASALLARHALEQLLEDFWSPIAPSLVATRNVRAQLIALRGYQPVRDAASPVSAAYAGLCRGCHHHPYELPPSRRSDAGTGSLKAVPRCAGQPVRALVTRCTEKRAEIVGSPAIRSSGRSWTRREPRSPRRRPALTRIGSTPWSREARRSCRS